jgi:hypothetical protein
MGSMGRDRTGRFGAEFGQQQDVRPRDAAVGDVADDGDAETFERRARSRMVRASSSACVGCSWVPSPALMIGMGR